uniref:plasmid mobilization relaxosome protein MobC n=1 Tax=Saccharothrix mutabilis TaxID=33921 RepID=UPI0031E2E2CD
MAEWEAAAVKLSRSGSALNQLARRANSGHVVGQQQLQAALTYHHRVLDELHRVLGAVDQHRGTRR